MAERVHSCGPMVIVVGEIAFRAIDNIYFAPSTCQSLEDQLRSWSSNPAQALVLLVVRYSFMGKHRDYSCC